MLLFEHTLETLRLLSELLSVCFPLLMPGMIMGATTAQPCSTPVLDLVSRLYDWESYDGSVVPNTYTTV